MRRVIVLLGLLLSLSAGANDEAIGYVKTVGGEAWVITGETKTPARIGLPIYAGSRLRTGPQGSIGVTFKDETVMSCGPDTTLDIDRYRYVPSQGMLELAASLVKGSLNYLSGVIAKLKPEAISVRTPTGTIGIRGTHFVARVEAQSE